MAEFFTPNNHLNVPDVAPEMLKADFWLDRCDAPAAPLWSPQQIAAYNARVPEILDVLDIFTLPETLSRDVITSHMEAPPQSPRYDGLGQPLSQDYFTMLTAEVRATLADQVPVRYGVIVRRTSLRGYPTDDVASDTPGEIKTDLNQGTSLDIGTVIALLATTADGKWVFGISPRYWGWLHREDIALTDRETALLFHDPAQFIITTASRGLIGLACGGGVTPQMGTRLPLLEATAEKFTVQVPVKNGDNLEIKTGIADRAQSPFHFHVGYLPPTQETLLRAAFSLLGEPYAWGGARLGIFGRDCSRYIKDVYALTGMNTPRNSRQMMRVGHAIALPEGTSTAERKAFIAENAEPGNILFMPGHVMIHLGDIDGEPYCIHTAGSAYMQTIVSTFDLYYPQKPSWADRITHIVQPG